MPVGDIFSNPARNRWERRGRRGPPRYTGYARRRVTTASLRVQRYRFKKIPSPRRTWQCRARQTSYSRTHGSKQIGRWAGGRYGSKSAGKNILAFIVFQKACRIEASVDAELGIAVGDRSYGMAPVGNTVGDRGRKSLLHGRKKAASAIPSGMADAQPLPPTEKHPMPAAKRRI